MENKGIASVFMVVLGLIFLPVAGPLAIIIVVLHIIFQSLFGDETRN
jgi:hypothetical protein